MVPDQQRPTRVLLVDDSIVVRSIIERIVETDPQLEVVGSVATAPEALSFLDGDAVDVIILDLEMPVMHGLTAIPLILAKSPATHVVILSANCEDGGPAAVQALALGAADTLLKPGKGTFAGRFGTTLIERIKALADQAPTGPFAAAEPTRQALPPRPALTPRQIAAVGIGASTGGILAINSFLSALPTDFARPIFITQHLPTGFIRYFAEQLQRVSHRTVKVAEDGMTVLPDHIYLAPGESHMRVLKLAGGCRLMLDRSPAPSGASPSVDPMLASLADCYGEQLCGVMLSGMGRDGFDGARRVKARGGLMLAQDITSSVVWGMPGVVVRDGLADAQADPTGLAELISQVALGGAEA
jgi:two-component system chemotaxis response regulator CheB